MVSTDDDATVSAEESGESGREPVNAKTLIILLIGIAAVAFSGPWVKQSNFEPSTSVILRVGIGLLVLLPFAFRERVKVGGLNRPGILLAVFGGIFLGIDFTAWNYSIYYVGAGIASVLLNLQIIILPLLAAIFDKDKIHKSFYILVPIMLVGVVLTGGVLDAAPSEGPETVYGININVLGTILGSVSGVCYGIYLYASRKATTMNPGRLVQPMAWAFAAQLVVPALFMLVFSDRGFDLTNGVLVDGTLPFDPETTPGDPITGMNWFWMIMLAVVGQAVAWTFIQYGSVRMNTTIVAGLLLLSPVATVAIIAPILFGEVPSFLQILGVVIVLVAVAYQNGLHLLVVRKLGGGKGSDSRAG